MSTLDAAVDQVLEAQCRSGKPLAVVLAGHNGSGKSTLWYCRLAPRLQLPLINADRMLLSVLPEAGPSGLPAWAVEGYFVLLVFVGLAHVDLSIARVATRVAAGGHGVDEQKLRHRFPRTQQAIASAADVADATLMADNSLDESRAFTVCRVQIGSNVLYDCRDGPRTPSPILSWMEVVSPRK